MMRGNVSATVNTNLEYDVVIPEEDKAWISLVPATKALRQDVLTFSVAENTETSKRSSTISINYKSGDLAKTFVIVQDAASGEVAAEWQEANLAGFYDGGTSMSYESRTTIDGWGVVKSKIMDYSDFTEAEANIQLAGNMNAPGILTSPLIDGGCSVIVVDYGLYGLPASCPSGLSMNLKVLDASDSELLNKDIVLVNEDMVRYKIMTSEEFAVNATGQFKIIITNNCPTQRTVDVMDNTSILRIAWKPYSE